MRIGFLFAVIALVACRSPSREEVGVVDAAAPSPSASEPIVADASGAIEAGAVVDASSSPAPAPNGGAQARRQASSLQYAVQIILLFEDAQQVPYEDHAENDVSTTNPSFWRGVLARCPGATLERVWKTNAVRSLGETKALPSASGMMMERYFEIDCPPSTNGDALVAWLVKQPTMISTAWMQARASDP